MYEHNVSLANYLRVVAEHDEYNEHNVWNVWFLKRLYRWKFQCKILLRKMCKATMDLTFVTTNFIYLAYSTIYRRQIKVLYLEMLYSQTINYKSKNVKDSFFLDLLFCLSFF